MHRTLKETNELIDCGLGKEPCDVVLTNLRLVNVCSREVIDNGKIFIKGKRIVSIDPSATLEARETVDCDGLYAMPGFIDTHMHFSSSMVNPEAMAQAIVPQGTTTLCVDFMEIGNVAGAAVVDVMLEKANELPYRIVVEVPTRIPTAPGLETTGRVISVEETRELLARPDTISLGEIAPAKILHRTDENIQKIVDALNMGKVVNGHAVGCTYQELSVYASAGITDDHECVEWEEALGRLRCGMHVLVREGSGARNEAMFVENALKLGCGFDNACFCTDDKHVTDIFREGHINHNVNLAIRLGVDPVTAIRMASYNAAKHFHVDQDFGSLTPGRFADIILAPSIEEVHPQAVWFQGEKVFERGVLSVRRTEHAYPDWIRNTVHLAREITPASFAVPAPTGAKELVSVVVPELVEDQIVNVRTVRELPVSDGLVQRDPASDVMKFAVVERYGKNGNVNTCFVRGFTLERGAMAYSMSHNHQNICVVGANDEDMAVAVNAVRDLRGGLVTVIDGEIACSMALTIGGLISEELDAVTIAEQLDAMNESARATGCVLPAPFMTLSFIGHPAIPDLAPTDRGMVDVATQTIVSIFV